MALKIRLRRMGRKKAPHYRIVVAESTMPRDGRFVATIGHYNPTTHPVTLVVDRDKALSWIDRGAVPTDTVRSLLRKGGVFGALPEIPDGVVATVAAAVTGAAKKAAGAVKGAAGAVKDAAETVVERVTGDDETAEPAAEASVAEVDETPAPEAETPAAEAAAAPEAE
ncbi:MAG: 30S ribosomal protein S16, partial [Gemmatimonadota bacterium]|nr:30S ribosomal protein S16 [Gemmatimonadota bacterium]